MYVFRYNILSNNCEHFARWCKTGSKRSMQSESFVRSMTQRLTTFLEASVAGSKWLFSSPQGKAVLKHGANVVQNSVNANLLKDAAQTAVGNEVTPLLAPLSFVMPTLMICREIQTLCRDVSDAREQRRRGHITRDEFIKITIKRTTESCGSVAGVGIALSIPFTRNSIGCTLASIIGHGIGSVVGRGLACAYGRRSSCK